MGEWVRSGQAKCFDPPRGCGVFTVQWNGKGPAELHHAPGCPVKALDDELDEARAGETWEGTIMLRVRVTGASPDEITSWLEGQEIGYGKLPWDVPRTHTADVEILEATPLAHNHSGPEYH